MPIWVRVPALIAFVLAVALVGAILFGAWDGSGGHGAGAGHGSGDRSEMTDRTGGGRGHGSSNGRRDHAGGGRDHSAGSETRPRDHSG
jgi:hypothetical protein